MGIQSSGAYICGWLAELKVGNRSGGWQTMNRLLENWWLKGSEWAGPHGPFVQPVHY